MNVIKARHRARKLKIGDTVRILNGDYIGEAEIIKVSSIGKTIHIRPYKVTQLLEISIDTDVDKESYKDKIVPADLVYRVVHRRAGYWKVTKQDIYVEVNT